MVRVSNRFRNITRDYYIMIRLDNLTENGDIVLNTSSSNYMSYNDSAMECARYIMDSDSEQIDYNSYIEEGNDPRDHILYHAAVILGLTSEFEDDITNFLKETS